MLSHPIVRTAMGLLAAGALTGALAPVVLAHGAHASARSERAHAVAVVDRVEDRFEQAAKKEASEARADVDKAHADADEHEVDDDAANLRARDMAEDRAEQARIESAEQAVLARERAREALIRALVMQFMRTDR